MNAATLNSDRLRLTLLALQQGPMTTAQIHEMTGSMAVATDVSALRHNGISVDCQLLLVDRDTRKKVYEYSLPTKVGNV